MPGPELSTHLARMWLQCPFGLTLYCAHALLLELNSKGPIERVSHQESLFLGMFASVCAFFCVRGWEASVSVCSSFPLSLCLGTCPSLFRFPFSLPSIKSQKVDQKGIL